MPDPTHAALLAALVADPDDRLARLALADWYEEQGTRKGSREAARIRRAVGAKCWRSSYARIDVAMGRRVPRNVSPLLLPYIWEVFVRTAGLVTAARCRLSTWHAFSRGWVQDHPISQVTLYSDQPFERAYHAFSPVPGPSGYYWLASAAGRILTPNVQCAILPAWLFDILRNMDGTGRGISSNPEHAIWHDDIQARKALSNAAILWAHSAPA